MKLGWVQRVRTHDPHATCDPPSVAEKLKEMMETVRLTKTQKRNEQRKRAREREKERADEEQKTLSMEVAAYDLKVKHAETPILWYLRGIGYSLTGFVFHHKRFHNGARIVTGAKTGRRHDIFSRSRGLVLVDTESSGADGGKETFKLVYNVWVNWQDYTFDDYYNFERIKENQERYNKLEVYTNKYGHLPCIYFQGWTVTGGIWGYSVFNPDIVNGTIIKTLPVIEGGIDTRYDKRHGLIVISTLYPDCTHTDTDTDTHPGMFRVLRDPWCHTPGSPFIRPTDIL